MRELEQQQQEDKIAKVKAKATVKAKVTAMATTVELRPPPNQKRI